MPALPTRLIVPPMNRMGVAAAASSITAAGDFYAAIIIVEESGTVTGFKFATAVVTTGCTLEGRLETVSAAGAPTNTLYDKEAHGTVVVENTDDEVLKTVNFVGNVAVKAGDLLAIVLRISSGVPSSLGIRGMSTDCATGPPLRFRRQSGAETLALQVPNMALIYEGGVAKALVAGLPYSTLTALSMSTTTTPDEAGIKFTMPYSARSDGFFIRLGNDATFQPAEAVLYDAANTVLASVALNEGPIKGLTTEYPYEGKWLTPADLKKGRTYRLVLKPTTSTSWTTILNKLSAWAAEPKSFADLQIAYTQRTDAGAWSDTVGTIVPMALSLDRLYQPGGSFF